MKKCLLSLILCFVLMGSLFPAVAFGSPLPLQAAQAPDVAVFRKTDPVSFTPDQMKRLQNRIGSSRKRGEEKSEAFEKEADFWSRGSSRYFYRKLKASAKAYYNRLDGVCLSYLGGKGKSAEEDGYYYMEEVRYTDLSLDEMMDATWLFIYENPQYYFLDFGFGYAVSGDRGAKAGEVALSVYRTFSRLEAVIDAREKIKTSVEAYLEEAASYRSDLAKETFFHDALVQDTTYEENALDQSAASVFLNGRSVCMGYSMAFEFLMNLSGIQTLVVTSETHAWNQVFLGGRWYLVDVTWDDNDDGRISREFFNISSKEAKAKDGRQKAHVPEKLFATVGTPSCTTDKKMKKK